MATDLCLRALSFLPPSISLYPSRSSRNEPRVGEILDGGMTTEANPRETSAAITILENLIFHFHPGWKHAPPAALPNFYDRFHFPPFPNFRLHSPPEEKRKRKKEEERSK